MVSLKTVQSILLGSAVADAVGVPVEFKSRAELKKNPVTSMREFGTWRQPAGTWSDDTSLTIATMESIARLKRIDYYDILNNFARWYVQNEFVAGDTGFDCGNTTAAGIERFLHKIPPAFCGMDGENSNGNGSIMRIMPVAVYLYKLHGRNFYDKEIKIIHDVSALTHAHARSLIGCAIYCMFAAQLLDGEKISDALTNALSAAEKYYIVDEKFSSELKYYSRLFQPDFANLPEEKINSGGYVVDTLEAAVWCVLNTDNYRDLVLKAVNLGHDTDTTATVAGGIGGILYGEEGIPSEWLAELKKADYLRNIAANFFDAIV
ncbi:MAG: ADP-ribosylglycohydrolase family protein [Selenomonadaceae bacterium]|nr:ADP-ribosylglycohydrolase family protein [Selenomonadaceae bacterium]